MKTYPITDMCNKSKGHLSTVQIQICKLRKYVEFSQKPFCIIFSLRTIFFLIVIIGKDASMNCILHINGILVNYYRIVLLQLSEGYERIFISFLRIGKAKLMCYVSIYCTLKIWEFDVSYKTRQIHEQTTYLRTLKIWQNNWVHCKAKNHID